jgi:hypothetical protein
MSRTAFSSERKDGNVIRRASGKSDWEDVFQNRVFVGATGTISPKTGSKTARREALYKKTGPNQSVLEAYF